MTPLQLQRADLDALLRLARYLGVPVRRRQREHEETYRDRLMHAILRHRKRTR